MPIPLRKQLLYNVNLTFPEFRQHDTLGPASSALSFLDTTCDEWHQRFVERVFSAIDARQFLPIYRMSDGEYRFALRSGKVRASSIRGKIELALLRARGLRGAHKSGSPEYGFEAYSPQEVELATATFLASMRRHSAEGLFALSLHDTRLVKRYRSVILDWYDDHGIRVDSDNYFLFYSVYVLLHGSDRHRLYRDRRILVVTSLTPQKKSGILAGLLACGARSVEFLEISASKALFDQVDLTGLETTPDLVLVGAGIGSVSIMQQLRPLNAVCIDCGFGLSTLADPDLGYRRPYCIPDSEM